MTHEEEFVHGLTAGNISPASALDFFASCTEDKKNAILTLLEITVPASAPAEPQLRDDAEVVLPERTLSLRTNRTCTAANRDFIQAFVERYAAKTKRSKTMTAQCRTSLADQRLSANFNPLLKETHYPILLERACGAYLDDVDGNRFIDISSDFGVNLFGHAPQFLNEALQEQLKQGAALSGRYGNLGEASHLFCALSGHDRVVFCQSGTEALMSAVRIARAHTDRQKVAVFNYSYHGHADVFLNEFTPGVSEASLSDAIALAYGEDQSLSCIRENATDLAAIVVEPVQSERLDLQPVDFLKQLRNIATETGIVLIFDEMITGFRVHPQGCQGLFGIKADLATYGKILGGGLPAGAVAGHADIMSWVDGGAWQYGDASKPGPATYIAGTHTQNPLKTAATLAVLRELQRVSPDLQTSLTGKTTDLVDRINDFATRRGLPVRAVSFGSQFRFSFLSRQFTLTQALFQLLLNDLGIRHQLHGNCFLTAAHSDEDIDAISQAVCRALDILREQDFFYQGQDQDQSDETAPAPIPRGRGGSSETRGTSRPAVPFHEKQPALNGSVSSSLTALVSDPEPVTAQVQQIIAEFLELDAAEIARDEDLGNFGLDSIMFVKILKLVSAHVGHKLSLKAFAEVNTIAEFGAQVCIELAQAATIQSNARLIEPEPESEAEPAVADAASFVASAQSESPRNAASRNGPGVPETIGSADIAIVGMSGTFAGAPDIASFWENLLEGRREISEVPVERWRWQDVYAPGATPGRTQSKWGGFIDGHDLFDPMFFRISPREARFMDPQERILLMQAYRAIEDSSLNPERLQGCPVGVFVGYEFTDYAEIIREARNNDAGDDTTDMPARPYYLANRLSSVFDFTGPSEAINVNCASSAVSLNRACQSLLQGESETAIVAGISLNLVAENYMQAGELLSPDGSCRVFGQDANGYTKGEGCVVLVLHRLEDALKQAIPVYAVIKNCHQSHRGRGNSISEVCPDALGRTIRDCHRFAGISPDTIRYIEVDGYSTTNGDQLECQAIREALDADRGADNGRSCALGSLKSNYGHLEPASGLASVAKVALSLKNGRFPATIGVGEVNDQLEINNPGDGLYLATEAISVDDIRGTSGAPIRAGVNSFADTGAYVHIVLEEFPQPAASPTPVDEQIFVLSARSAGALQDYLKAWIHFLDMNPDIPLVRLAYTMQVGRAPLKHRFACTADSVAALTRRLRAAAAGDFSGNAFMGTGAAAPSGPGGTGSVEPGFGPAEIARRWVTGGEVDWSTFHAEQALIPLHCLPTYPFALRRLWIAPADEQTDQTSEVGDAMRSDMPQSEPMVRENSETHTPPAEQSPDDADRRLPAAAVQPTAPATASLSAMPSNGGLIEVMQDVRAIVDEFLELAPDEEIDEDANFADMGLTSLAIVEFVDQINMRFGLALPETTAFDFPNIESLASHIVESSNPPVQAVDVADFAGIELFHSSQH